MPRARNSPDTHRDDSVIRIDKWLWAARFYKTRSLATQAIDAGHVRVGSQRCKPGRAVQIGDRIELTRAGEELEVVVRDLSSQRGPAPVAQALYQETESSIARRTKAAALRKAGNDVPEHGARPTKRDRRELDRWKSRSP
ncbi:MAG: RNA-binding S4 domain-containing protein [Zoogloeaceae bacterium]|mgnify:CR=1 FL=1|nr:RNA-binding S4 domain-containing protein [Zoogloeaceae bacterium]